MNLDILQKLRFNKYSPQILIVSLILLVYIQNLWFDFAYLDDNLIVFSEYEKIDSLSKIPNAFLSGYLQDNYYRPMIMISFIIDTAIAGQSSMMYHLTNLILHICVTLLFFNLLIKLGIKQNISLLLSIFYAIHPLNTNAVSWIVGRNDLLLALFSLLSLLSFIEYQSNRRKVSLFISIIFYFFAMLSKEVGILLPLIFILYGWLNRKEYNFNFKNSIHLLTYSIPFLLYFFLRKEVSNNIVQDDISIKALIKNIYIIFEYIGKLLYYPAIEPLSTKNYFLMIVGILFFLVFILSYFKIRKKLKNKDIFLFGVLFFLILSLPPLLVNINASDGGFNYIDCRGYLPLIGIFISLGVLLQSINFREYNKIIIIIPLSLFFIYTLTYNFHKNVVYRNGKVFWSTVTELHPDRATYWIGYGYYFYDNKNFVEAAKCAEKAIQIKPEIPEYYQKAALAYESYGDLIKANEVLEGSLKINKDNPVTIINLIKNYLKLKQIDNGNYWLNKFLQLDLKNKKAKSELSSSLSYYFAQNNLFQEAIKLMKGALIVDPNNAVYNNDLGVFFVKEGKTDSAKIYFEKAVTYEPNNADYQKNLNYINMQIGK